ncbi:amidohydrolase [Sulfitobacter alexandrii]|uniref:Amidohydrolase n=1 Tax=Sulfitobacter alexandrii TaxID=1917485 RepID=A0A1J0WEP5_9RHOB|nr:amidohydrolase [Sulfitobacter alexandrii]APE42791.1 amidohydrolase [Sulfitobacter alexandrii]
MGDVTLFKAKKIITMDPSMPEATHVAVRDGRILAVGGPDCADQWGAAERDDRLADSVLMPGLVEGHAHMMAGSMWNFAYAGYHDRIDPDGAVHPGMTTIDAVIDRLRAHVKTLDDGAPLIAWGFDPIFLRSERLNKAHLDVVASDRPVAVLFSNFHLMCVNSVALEQANYTSASNVEGVVKGPDGAPTGELQEMAAMFPVMRRVGIDFRGLSQGEDAMRTYAQVCRHAGVTTVTDLYSSMEDEDIDAMLRVTGADDFGVRLVPALGATGAAPDALAGRVGEMHKRSTDKLRLGAIKIMTDGSIQGWTARVKWPGYVGGQPNGIWNAPPEEIFAVCKGMQKHGIQMHIHVNGDEAAEVALDALEAAARKHPWPGARHVLQHCQMMDGDLYRRAAELGVCTNIFANHLYYFGDQHAELTLGLGRARRMNAVRTALDAGVNVAIHSDAPVTPLGPLFTAWCAVMRQTMTGQTLGENLRIEVSEALRLITLGAAYTLKMDADIGSIEPGKFADFAVLGQDPTAVEPAALKDVPVLGTVLGGRVMLL